ncbi:MAG: hypothetical protein AAGF99_00290 [Bacteroidota bacterium]
MPPDLPTSDELRDSIRSPDDLAQTYLTLALARKPADDIARLPRGLAMVYAIVFAYANALHIATRLLDPSCNTAEETLALMNQFDAQIHLAGQFQSMIGTPDDFEQLHTDLQHFLHEHS